MKPLIVISGPTASGKSAIAHAIFENVGNVEIINADSMQLYQELPIITAQPEYLKFPNYKLYGTYSYKQNSSVAKWLESTKNIIDNCNKQNIIPIIVGGTGLYIKSLIHGLSDLPDISTSTREQVAQMFLELGISKFYQLLQSKTGEVSINKNDKYRMTRAMEVFLETGKTISSFYEETKENHPFKLLHITLVPQRNMLHKTCNERFVQMLEQGAVEEIEAFSKLDNSSESQLTRALGYKDLSNYISGNITLEKAIELSQAQTRQYAKRQLTWFRHQAPEATAIEYDNFKNALEESTKLVTKFFT